MKSFLTILSVLIAAIHGIFLNQFLYKFIYQISIYILVSDAVNAGCSAAAPQSRIECGWPGINREKCNAMKCCYNDSVPGVKWCFKKKRLSI